MVDEFEFGKLYYNPEYDGEEYYFMYLGTDGGYHEYFDLTRGEWQKGVLDHGCLCLYVHEEEQ